MRFSVVAPGILLASIMLLPAARCGGETPARIELQNDPEAGNLRVSMDGREILVYQYADDVDLPHCWPLRSPSGKNMLVQKTEPYPHHRSFWFADTVRLDGGREVSTYNAFYSGRKRGENDFAPPFRDHVRHLSFRRLEAIGDEAVVEADLVWEMDVDRPVLNESRRMTVRALEDGEYSMEMTFVLTAVCGDVEFVSDDVHYAWPYLRVQTRFSGERGGVITSDTGAAGQEATNGETALWMDYSNTVEGITEGIAVFQKPDGEEHRWLTREYGCFGPRRADARSGRPFTLRKGDSLSQCVNILVHRGDAVTGRVAERYRDWIAGRVE